MKSGLGRFGEAWARGYLTRKGYQIVAGNVHYRTGEIDIVARDGETLVFVEVKCRRSSNYGSSLEAVTASKYARLSRAVQQYVSEHGLEEAAYRLDVLALEVGVSGEVTAAEHLEAVEAPL